MVFTSGNALFEAKKHLHGNIHAFPSSVDRAHFAQSRRHPSEPADQACIAVPRLGFFGVIDERMDFALLEAVARARPSWQLILLGSVVKVDLAELPRLPNIHYLGSKSYSELPGYVAGWDVALLPFAKNDATRLISPTKTPEYLAAGKPVVSTSIRDVVRPYSVLGLARIADTPRDVVSACEAAMSEPNERLLRRADPFLARLSWDRTWQAMQALMDRAAERDRRGSSGQQLCFKCHRLSVGSLSPNWATWDRAVVAFVPWQAAFATSTWGLAGLPMNSATRFATGIVFGTPLAQDALMATNEKSKQSAEASPRSNSQKSDKSAGLAGSSNQREQSAASAKNEKSKSPRKQSNGSSARR